MEPLGLSLRYLRFDRMDGDDGQVTFEAMADVRPEEAGRVRDEWQRVLAWVRAQWPDREGPLDEGGDWDHACTERRLADWHEFTVTLTGTRAVTDVLAEQLADD